MSTSLPMYNQNAARKTDWSRYKKATVNLDNLVARAILPDPWEPVFLAEKAPFTSGWQKGQITSESLAAVRKDCRITGIGLRTGKLAVVDIDCTDDDLTEIINAVMIEVLGSDPLYRRGSKGLAALYWNDSPVGKLSIPFTKNGISHKIEILGLGQQMGGFGKVKATDKAPAFDYKWLDGYSPLNVLPYELPGASGEKLREFLGAVKITLAANGCVVGNITGGSTLERDPDAGASCFPDDINSDSAVSAFRHILKERKPAIEGHSGNGHTYATACLAHDNNISEDKCFELMTEEGGWNERCQPAWDHDELKGVIQNAYNYAKRPMGNVIPLMDYFGDGDDDDFILPDDFYKTEGPANDVELPGVTRAKGKRRRFLPMSYHKQDNIPQEKYIVEGLLAEKNIAWFYGPTGAYKTYGILALLLALAAGHAEWCGFPLATDGGKRKWKVIFISGEGGMSLVTERKKAFLQKHGLTSSDVEFYPIIGNMPNMLKGQDVDDLLDDITSPESPCPDPDIIFWDTYSRATPGADGNSTTDLSILIDQVERMKNEKLPALKLAGFVDHTGLEETRQRGTTGKSQNADAVIRINRPAGGAKLKSQWTPEKVRNGDPPDAFIVESTPETIDFLNVAGVNVPKTVPVFDVRGNKVPASNNGSGPLKHFKGTGELTDTDLVRVVLDKERAGALLTVADVVAAADKLVTLTGPSPEKRRASFEKRLRNLLSKDTPAAERARKALLGLVAWKHKNKVTVYTFTGQGGSLGEWQAFNQINQADTMEAHNIQEMEHDDHPEESEGQ